MKRNLTIDILRLAAAFAVVCLHNFSGSGVAGAEETVALARFAVPLFFLFSGYFCAVMSRERKLRQILRIFAWAVLANLCYLALNLSRQSNEFLVKLRMQQIFPEGSVKNLLLFNESPISAHLWFLGAFLYILILDLLLGWLFDKLPQWVKWAFTIALLLGGLTLYQLLTRNPEVNFQLYHYRNFLLFGLPFFLIGKLIRVSSFDKLKISGFLYPSLLFFAATLTIFEYRALGAWELYTGSIATTLLLAHLALRYPLTDAPKAVRAIAWLGRETAFTVYIIHIYFLDLIRGIYWANHPWQFEFGVYHMIPLLVFVISMAAALLIAFARIGAKKLLAKALKKRAPAQE